MSRNGLKLLRLLFDASPRERTESNAYFAKRLGCSERTVSRCLAELAKRELVQIEHSRPTGPGEVARFIKVDDMGADLLLSRVTVR